MTALVATIRLVRDKHGDYGIEVDHGGQGEIEGQLRTVDAAMERAKQLVLDELRRRPTDPELDPVKVPPTGWVT